MANDNPDSDISEADVDQVAKSLADLDDMDADLFGGSTKKNSIKNRSGKPTTPRRSGNTPRSRSGTPRSGKLGSPRRTPGSPTRSETSPPGSARGSVKRPPPKPSSPPPPQVDYKPGTAPGKMTDLGRESENLKPNQMQKHEVQRPQTVPKVKPKIDYGEFNEEDPLAGILSDEEESEIEVKKPSLKAALKQQSSDDLFTPAKSKQNVQIETNVSNSGGSVPSLYDRPPTRSGTGTTESNVNITPKPVSVSKNTVFSDDDDEDLLDGLGITEKLKSPLKSSVTTEKEETRSARSVFDSLLDKDNVNKHLQKSEKKEFILDTKKLSQKDSEDEEEGFGEYRPSSVSSRPNSRRSVRFQDDDIFGTGDKPLSRGRPDSATSSKPVDDTKDWLELATGNRSSIDNKREISQTQMKQDMPASSNRKQTSLSKEDSNDDWFNKLIALNNGHEEEETHPPVNKEKTTPISKPKQDKITQPSSGDYLDLGPEIDLDDMISKKPESPTFPVSTKQTKDIFEMPNTKQENLDASFQRRRILADFDDDILPAAETTLLNKYEDSTFITNSQVPVSSHSVQLDQLDASPHFKKKIPKSVPSGHLEESVIQMAVYPSRDPNLQSLRNISTPSSSAAHTVSTGYTSAPVQHIPEQFHTPQPQLNTQPAGIPVTSFSSPQQLVLPNSLPEAQTMIRKLTVENQYSDSLMDGIRRRYEEEVVAVETSFRNRMKILEESNQKKEARLREETEQLMEKHLTRVRQMEEEKAEMANENYRKLEELERLKAKDIESIKDHHRFSFSELKREHEEAIERLKEAKNREINAVANANDTSRNLSTVVEQMQTNAKDLGSLQTQVESIHRKGLDEKEISLKAKDEQLRNLQERLSRQEDDNEKERKRLEDLISRMEAQLRDQTRLLDEERWKMKGDISRLEANQRSLEDEKRMWLEQQSRERASLERAKDNFQEENKGSLSQLTSERRILAEERMKWNVDLKLHREQSHQEAIKMAQAEAEYEVLTKTIAEEKTRSAARKQELQLEVDRLSSERAKIEREKALLEAEKERLSNMALQIKLKSSEIESMTEMANRVQSDGDRSLMESKNIEAQQAQRLANIQHELQKLKSKEDHIAQEKLQIAKERQELDKLRHSGLCVNCRSLIIGTVAPGVNSIVNSPNIMMSSPIPGVYHGKYSNSNYNGVGGGQLSVNAIETITTTIAADRSIRMWKIQAIKDKDFLEEESMFLETLKHSPYH